MLGCMQCHPWIRVQRKWQTVSMGRVVFERKSDNETGFVVAGGILNWQQPGKKAANVGNGVLEWEYGWRIPERKKKKWESVVWEDRRHKARAQRLIEDRKMETAGDQQLIEDRKTEQRASLSQLSWKETLRCVQWSGVSGGEMRARREIKTRKEQAHAAKVRKSEITNLKRHSHSQKLLYTSPLYYCDQIAGRNLREERFV